MGDDYVSIQGINSDGYGNISKRVMRDKTIPVTSKAIYAYICSYTGPGMVAWPGRKTACEDLGINKNTWTKYMKPLKEKDYIRITQRIGESGKYTSNLYTVVMVPCPKLSDTVKADTVPCPKLRDTVVSDTNNNNLLNKDLININIAEKLSTRKNAFTNYRNSEGHISAIPNRTRGGEILRPQR